MEIGGPPDPSEELFPSAFIQRHPLLIPADTLHGSWVVSGFSGHVFLLCKEKACQLRNLIVIRYNILELLFEVHTLVSTVRLTSSL